MMPYQGEEERAKLGQSLNKEAIALAIQGRWEEAVVVNRDIIEKFPPDAEAYNRLGKALSELGDFAQAREAYLKALELTPYNVIAKKNLARLDSLSESMAASDEEYQRDFPLRTQARGITPGLFITGTGKTGVVNLYNLASSEVLAKLGYGDEIQLTVEGQRLIVERDSGEYLGQIEPKHALRLIKLMAGGNKYRATVLTVGVNEMRVLVREVYQHPSQVGYLSFPVKDHFDSHIKGSSPRRIITEEGEQPDEPRHPKERAFDFEIGEGFSLEGFSVLDESKSLEEEFEE